MEMDLKKMISTMQSTGKKVGEKTVQLVDLSKLKLERGRCWPPW